MATTERTAIPVSLQAAGPAVPETEIGAGGVLVCQALGNRSLPGKARGFRGQDTVERHGGFDVLIENVVHKEQENPGSNGREMIDDFRLPGVKAVAS